MTVRRIACDRAWVAGPASGGGAGAARMADRVAIDVDGDRITDVRTADDPGGAAAFAEAARSGLHLGGVTVPGLVNAHSHAFHRALRGRTHHGEGTFWTWRQQMYAVAARLDPDRLGALARGAFAEMLEAGITCVGEFHYLHHGPGGTPYDDPNATGRAILDAAADVGIRITLLDALYLTADIGRGAEGGATGDAGGRGLDPVQRRFSDGSAGAWLDRLADLGPAAGPATRVGAALHSVRAVPPHAAATAVAGLAHLGDGHGGRPVLHAHVAEQPAEVTRCREVHGRSPVALLADVGALGPHATAVHAVWLDDADVATLGRTRTTACACPTTERDLADGVVRADRLLAAGAGLALGTDQHATTDLLEEARAVELDLRLVTQVRGGVPADDLLRAATAGGATSLGWHDAGRIAPGALADLTTIGWGSARLAGVPRTPEGVVHAASAGDVTDVVVGGRHVVAGGRHRHLDVAEALDRAIRDLHDEGAP